MERIRSLNGTDSQGVVGHTLRGSRFRFSYFAMMFTGFCLAIGTGCTTLSKTKKEMLAVFESAEPENPATMLTFGFSPKLEYLPDPTKNGVKGAGLVGRLFLQDTTGGHATANGSFYVMMVDDTVRPANYPTKNGEIYEITQDKLLQLLTKDERGIPMYALFIPWPKDWNDVTRVRIQARYEPSNGPVLFGQEMRVQLDLTGEFTQGWIDSRTGKPLNGQPASTHRSAHPVIQTSSQGIPMISDAMRSSPLIQNPVQQADFNSMPPSLNQVPPAFQQAPLAPGPNGSQVFTRTGTGPVPTGPPQPITELGSPMPNASLPGQPMTMPNYPAIPSTLSAGPPITQMPALQPGTQAPMQWPAGNGMTPPAVGPIGELQPIVIKRGG